MLVCIVVFIICCGGAQSTSPFYGTRFIDQVLKNEYLEKLGKLNLIPAAMPEFQLETDKIGNKSVEFSRFYGKGTLKNLNNLKRDRLCSKPVDVENGSIAFNCSLKINSLVLKYENMILTYWNNNTQPIEGEVKTTFRNTKIEMEVLAPKQKGEAEITKYQVNLDEKPQNEVSGVRPRSLRNMIKQDEEYQLKVREFVLSILNENIKIAITEAFILRPFINTKSNNERT